MHLLSQGQGAHKDLHAEPVLPASGMTAGHRSVPPAAAATQTTPQRSRQHFCAVHMITNTLRLAGLAGPASARLAPRAAAAPLPLVPSACCAKAPAARPAAARRALMVKAAATPGGATAPAGNAADSLADAFQRLAGVRVYQVSSGQELELTSLWGADERAVVACARHMG